MKKVLLLFFMSCFLYSCASKAKKIENIPLMKAVDPIKSEEFNPLDFEKSIPSSSLIRNSLVSFTKTYQRVYSDSNVISMGAGKEMLAVLKADEIGFTMPYCSGLLIKKKYDHIRVFGLEALVYNKEKVEVFSSSECASVGEYPRLLKGFVELISGYILEWEGSMAALRNSYNGDVLFNNDTGIQILAAGIYKGKPALLQNNGYLLTYSPSFKAFILETQFPAGYKSIYHSEGYFYGILQDEDKFFVLYDDDIKISSDTDCRISPFGVAALCNNTLITRSKKYHDVPNAEYFSAGKGAYLTLQDTNINIYYLITVWQRFLSMSYTMPIPCVYQNKVYYKSFSGKIFENSKNGEKEVKNIPKGCSSKNVVLNYGRFYFNNKDMGLFSTPITNNSDAVMFRRIENNTIYYYFENFKKNNK